MRLKGISWAEQHFEKIVAGVFAVAAVGVLTYQFAGKSAVVKVGNKELPIDQAYDEVAAVAKRVKGEIEEPDPKDLPDPAFKSPLDDFIARYNGKVAPATQLAVDIGGRGSTLNITTSSSAGASAEYASLLIPAVSVPVAEAYMSTISPAEPARSEEVMAVMPSKAAPFDIPSVTVEATFNGKALKSALEADPDGPGPIRPIPRNWIESQGNLQVLAVELEREELLPDGKWGNTAKVKHMPGRLSLEPEIEAGVKGAEELYRLVQDASEHASEIRRPDFYDLWVGEDWMPPTDRRVAEEAAAVTGADAKAKAVATVKDLEKRLAFQKQLREKMGPETGGRDAGRAPEPPRQGGGGGGGKRGGPGGGGGGGQRQGPRPEQPKQYSDGERRAADQRITDLETRLVAARKDAGIDTPSEATPAPTDTAMKAEPGVLDSDALRLWSHDVTVQRGKSYRYRMTLVFPNPLFGKGSVMVPAQAELARNTLIRSQPSEWSAPVTVDQQVYCFITSARPARSAGPGGVIAVRNSAASAEFFEFTMGYWRKGTRDFEPGDRLMAEIQVPDITKLAMANQPGNPANPAVPPAAPPAPIPSGKGPVGRQNEGPRPGPENKPEPPPATLATVPKPVAIDAVLLSVDSAPLTKGDAAPRALAYLGWDAGVIEPRFPELDRLQRAYLRVTQSYDASKAAAAPKPQETEAPGRQPPPGQMPPDDRRPPIGPGGGGGGG